MHVLLRCVQLQSDQLDKLKLEKAKAENLVNEAKTEAQAAETKAQAAETEAQAAKTEAQAAKTEAQAAETKAQAATLLAYRRGFLSEISKGQYADKSYEDFVKAAKALEIPYDANSIRHRLRFSSITPGDDQKSSIPSVGQQGNVALSKFSMHFLECGSRTCNLNVSMEFIECQVLKHCFGGDQVSHNQYHLSNYNI